MSDGNTKQNKVVQLTGRIVSAYLSHNHVPVGELPSFIRNLHGSFVNITDGGAHAPTSMPKASAAEVKRSITPNYLISFEDGKHYKALRRHLTQRGLSPEQYRAKWGLPSDYPIVARAYSAMRAEMARSIGLGRPGRAGTTEASYKAPRPLEAVEEHRDEPHEPDDAPISKDLDESEVLEAEAPEITREPFEEGATLD